VNAFNNAPGIRRLIGSLLDLAPERDMPRFAPVSFDRWARGHQIPTIGNGKAAIAATPATDRDVILWLDTFNNYFHPETTRAAYDVLNAAGFNVRVPNRHLCCGRPLYDFGLIARAKAYLERIMATLDAHVEGGWPVVVLEPSCASVFRDELRNLFPNDPRAERLRRRTFLLSEFLNRHAHGYEPPRLDKKVVLHGHCHQKAIMKMTDEEALLRKMGVALEVPDAGCCGMAGPFGFEKEKYKVSVAVGERVLLPAVRQASPETLIVADGFSCQEQIAQLTGRRAMHVASVLELAGRQRTR
jgi:Fe-S oxidoreductase